MEKRKRKRFLAWLCTMAVIISGMVPTNVTYATVLQQETAESQAQDIVSEEDIVDCLDISESECSEGCVLDDGITVFDTWEENKSATVLSEENEPSEKQVVNEVVVFISFSDKGESIYEERGGYDYIMSMFDGADPSLKSYVDEYSWGQVEANTYVWPQNSDGTPKCYVDEHPSSYYLKQSTSNPNGYTSSEKYTRRQTLLKNAIASMGEDFLEQIGIADQPYNLVFMVPNEGSWNDLLWSHKSSITINGVSTVYNLITYNTNKKNITKTVTHEFMHSLGYPDLYRYTNTSEKPVDSWSIMASTSTAGHPLVYEKYKYGKWFEDGEGIQTISKSGRYELGPSTADPEENTIAYKIPVEGVTDQYFMIEYRGSSCSGYDSALSKFEGLIFYRVDTDLKGNSYGPPDEIYVLRDEYTISYSYYNGTEGRTEFSAFQLYNDTTDLGISVYNITMEDGYMSFDVEVPYVDLQASKKSPVSVEESTELVLSTSALGENYSYRFGAIIDGKEYELSGGYQSENSITVNMLEALKDKTARTHTLFVDVKNTSTGKIKRGTLSNYEIQGVQVSQITSDLLSPQVAGTTIQLSAIVEKEKASENNTYKFVVSKDGVEEKIVMDSNYTATWTPGETGIYTITYSVTDGYGITGTKTISYPIGDDTTAYVFYKKSSWSQAYIHYKVGSGEWTTSPGVKMADSSVDGYTWMYVIDVGSTSGTATAAFNNGNGTWDNNSEKNYTIKAGVNSTGGTSLKLSSVKIAADNQEGKQCKFTTTITGGIAPYSLDYKITRASDDSVVEEKTGVTLETKSHEISTAVEELGEYTISVSVKDAYGQTVSEELDFKVEGFTITGIKTSADSPQLSGKEITLTEQRKNAYVTEDGIQSKWTIKNNTTGTIKEEIVVDSTTLKWTPEEIGEYEITVETTDNAGETASYTIYYSIVEKIINQAIIYYANSSWSTAYIHYQIDAGEWTVVPGVVMEASSEQSGYTWKYILDCGTWCGNGSEQ